MADPIRDRTVSKTHSGFPDYLDFDTLRTRAIEYLGQLSGKIWTDYNVHDPGITILETLIYALMDLGYRTELPATDLFARNPTDQTKDDNFFTPARILANNPLTILDYRKLLVDLEGVKNAWLETDDQTSVRFCGDPVDQQASSDLRAAQDPCATTFLNGLYKVYLELEDEVDKDKHVYARVLRSVRQALLGHRNLCEDFVDIQVLCRLPIGVCAEIDLLPGADAEDVYIALAETLAEFFSPAPRFYSLAQLLEKGRTIDEIYAGRPLDIRQSHGFVDPSELEQLELRRVLHLSDVYQRVSALPGINRVRHLGWIKCCDQRKSVTEWTLTLPENHVPVFSLDCSGFSFTRNGLPETQDLAAFAAAYKVRNAGNTRALYPIPSLFLDRPVPAGVYREDLADYHSIQPEFPAVYGIRPGGLSQQTSPKRKAQALQLQGFLLFFDQLLANYLGQLSHLRDLFSLSSPKSGTGRTYFTGKLTDVPQLGNLLRFPLESSGSLGTSGDMLSYPTDRKRIELAILLGTPGDIDFDGRCHDGRPAFPPYRFCFAAERDLAIAQWQEDILNAGFRPVTVGLANGRFFFYWFTSHPDVALVSRNTYPDQKSAADAAASIGYAASFPENYRAYMDSDGGTDEWFSFDIELHIDVYAKYLRLLVEDQARYRSRRQDFLRHLLARFAETFTDFSLLSAPFLAPDLLESELIGQEERFLRQYDELSSKRGKGFDFSRDAWNNENISGFEKRVKALTGMPDWRQHALCHFVVEPADLLYQLSVTLFDQEFTVPNAVFNAAEGIASLTSIYNRFTQPVFECRFQPHTARYETFIRDDFGNAYVASKTFADEVSVRTYVAKLEQAFRFGPNVDRDVYVSRFINKVRFTRADGHVLAESREHFPDAASAAARGAQWASNLGAAVRDVALFTHGRLKKAARLAPVDVSRYPFLFIDESDFIFQPVEVVFLKEKRKRFSLLDRAATIQFDSVGDFSNLKNARRAYRAALVLLPLRASYTIERNLQTERFELFACHNNERVLRFLETFASEREGGQRLDRLLKELAPALRLLAVSEALPEDWSFRYRVSDTSGQSMDFVSDTPYGSREAAVSALRLFHAQPGKWEVSAGKQWVLGLSGTPDAPTLRTDPSLASAGHRRQAVHLVHFAQKLVAEVFGQTSATLRVQLENNRVNPGENFVYKLVDKDHMRAYHPMETGISSRVQAETLRDALIQRATGGYDYLEIVREGDVVRERRENGISWFHFQIKASNRRYLTGPKAGQELVLLESSVGYSSPEAAAAAFVSECLPLMKYGRQESEYGKGRQISLEEKLIHDTRPCAGNQTMAFVPAETMAEFGGYEVQKIIAPLIAGYPVRYHRKNKYEFVLGRPDPASGAFQTDWRSNEKFSTPEAAMRAFQFFLVLLKYGGNFYLEWRRTHRDFRLYIREVLAMSAHGFPTAEAAWGPTGVERFIVVSQAKQGFHLYQNRSTCRPGFYVACGNTGLQHPCTYDTPGRRDRMLNKLFQAGAFDFTVLLGKQTGSSFLWNDIQGKPLARIQTEIITGLANDPCEWLLLFSEAVYDDRNYRRKDGKLTLNCRYTPTGAKEELHLVLAEPADAAAGLRPWKEALRNTGCYFPVVRITDACGKPRFGLRIKLPGFDGCGEDFDCADPCAPCREKPGCEPDCYVAWKSDCCFDRCCDAYQFFLQIRTLLTDIRHYKPVFDGCCGSYGIALHPQLTLRATRAWQRGLPVADASRALCGDPDPAVAHAAHAPHLRHLCLNDVVAINPQYYPDDRTACDAVIRAKGLINAEGLHLVEHLLLRPRCRNTTGRFTDCDCASLPKPASDAGGGCHFPWHPGGAADPCADRHPVCFTPGCDPFSCIATVVLPAWPGRFRSAEGRKRLEKIMQREAPAHILLRFLWLRPRDFCCLEFQFKSWLQWMQGRMADPEYSNCDFFDLLFRNEYQPLPESTECRPCDCADPDPGCLPEETDPCAQVDVQQKINELFAWSTEGKYELSYCDPDGPPPVIGIAAPQVAGSELLALTRPEPLRHEAQPAAPSRETARLAQARAKKYEAVIDQVRAAIPDTALAELAMVYLHKPQPDAKALAILSARILADKGSRSAKHRPLTKKQKQKVIASLAAKWLDHVALTGDCTASLDALPALWKSWRAAGMDVARLRTEWNPAALQGKADDETLKSILSVMDKE